MDPALEFILNPAGKMGAALAQAGMFDYQKTLIGKMLENGAANQVVQTAAEENMEMIARSLVKRFLPGGAQILSAGDAAHEIEMAHREGIEQMQERGVPGFEKHVFTFNDSSGNEYFFDYWLDSSAEEFGGETRIYMEPRDEATKNALKSAEGNDQLQNEIEKKLRAAGSVLEARGLEDIQGFLMQGGDYQSKIQEGFNGIWNDVANGSFRLSSLSVEENKLAEADINYGTSVNYPTATI